MILMLVFVVAASMASAQGGGVPAGGAQGGGAGAGGGRGVTHWVIWNIPGTATKLAENVGAGASLPDGSHQENNIAGQPKYMGPAPPAGHPYHHYIFQLYALNAMLDLPATASRADIEKAIEGKIVARGAFTGKVKGS
jgi:Raf kinase inhibitor-like YbhB/YbcL family protein